MLQVVTTGVERGPCPTPHLVKDVGHVRSPVGPGLTNGIPTETAGRATPTKLGFASRETDGMAVALFCQKHCRHCIQSPPHVERTQVCLSKILLPCGCSLWVSSYHPCEDHDTPSEPDTNAEPPRASKGTQRVLRSMLS
jgi:hypothetical protein